MGPHSIYLCLLSIGIAIAEPQQQQQHMVTRLSKRVFVCCFFFIPHLYTLMLRLLGLVLCIVVEGALSAQYGLVKDYSGAQFFEGWNFYDHC